MSTIPPYVYKDADDSLQQGDIIQLSGYLRRLFKKYYIGLPIKPLETRYLMVINQTCDLVKNQERAPKTEHINLCVVSRFSNYISRLKSKFNKNQISDYCIVEEAVYQEIKNKIVRIINNSEAKEHFFLPQIFPFKEDMVAILSFSYPFRVKHYDLIKKNRVLSIRSDFQSKIGYLIGGLYNRIATPDLNSSNFSDSETSNFVDELLSINNFFPVKKTQYIKYIRENKKRVKTKNSIEVLIKEALNNEEKEKLSQFKKPLIRLLSTNIFKELKEKNIVNPTINESEIRGTLSTISILILSEPLILEDNFKVSMIELPAPRSAHIYPSGLESIGVVVGDRLPSFINLYNEILSGVKDHGEHCQPAFITFNNDKTAKFYDISLREIVIRQG